MKVLLLNQHMDGITYSEGKSFFPHKHEWIVRPDKINKLGRPYCTVCEGEPCWYELKEVDDTSGAYNFQINNGAIVVKKEQNKMSEAKITLAEELKEITKQSLKEQESNKKTRVDNFVSLVIEKARLRAKQGCNILDVYFTYDARPDVLAAMEILSKEDLKCNIKTEYSHVKSYGWQDRQELSTSTSYLQVSWK